MKTYNDAIYRLRSLNNMKHRLRKALGNVGIYLPIGASMLDVLYSVYFYYMFNLFGNNNSNWKEEYFPLDGIGLQNFVETTLSSNPGNNTFKDIADEIEGIAYPPTTEHAEEADDTILSRGLLEYFTGYGGGVDLKSRIEKVPNNTINTDDLLINTRNILERLLSLWEWRKSVVNGTRRKRKEDRQTPVIEENALLDDILFELQKEPTYRLPNLKIDSVKLTNEDLNIDYFRNHWEFNSSIDYPCTIYTKLSSNGYSSNMRSYTKMLFDPKNWFYNASLRIDNVRPNTVVGLYYKYTTNADTNIDSDFPNRVLHNTFNNYSWNKTRTTNMGLSNVNIGENINIGYKDKYKGIYDRNNSSTTCYSYLGWKPEIFLYSKAIPKAGVVPDDYGYGMDSPMDHMNLLDNDDFGNLGLTILVPNVVEKFMKEKAPSLSDLNNTSTYANPTMPYGGYYNNDTYFNVDQSLDTVKKIREVETVFLVGIYPVDKDNNIIYKDPIVFQFFSGEQLNDDLGLSFADYRKIKSPTTREKVLLRKYYNIKLGQMFYRNNYSRISTEKKITNIATDVYNNAGKEILGSINYDNNKVGDISKNLLYLYGRENYMPYVGKTPLQPGQNHNITNPDDNTYIQNITLPDTAEYTFNKYGNTKIAIQLYMASNNDNNMYGLDYFKNIKKANGGFIEDSTTRSSEALLNIPGSYMWLPYRVESTWSTGTETRTNKAFPFRGTDIIDTKVPLPSFGSYGGVSSPYMSYATDPVIIDCNKSNEYNAPWLDKRNAPYVAKVVTKNVEYYSNRVDTNSGSSGINITTMTKGIYIKIPNDLSLYMLNDESVKKYVKRKGKDEKEFLLEDREFYGRVKREKYIRVIKNALLGITVNYNPSTNSNSGVKNTNWFRTALPGSKLFNSSAHFDIVEYNEELYIRLNGQYIEDLEYAGLGKYGTVKIQLIFRNEFFRSDDPESPLNYKYVPTTGDVQLLREIAGQRIKLYRGGILAHPTDYNTRRARHIETGVFSGMEGVIDVSLTEEIAYKHKYTNGFPSFALDSGILTSVTDDHSSISLSDDNSVYDIISIEMDYPHWLELQIDNIERSPISSMETDTNEMSLPIPINILDLENFDFLEYNTVENSYVNGIDSVSMVSPKLRLRRPNENPNDTRRYIDFYRMLNFWYIFRPKVKFFNKVGEEVYTNIYIESYNEWRTRILTENRDYFNKKNTKVNNSAIDLEDVFNIKCYRRDYNSYDSDIYNTINYGYNRNLNSENLYNIMKFIILNHTVYIDSSTTSTSVIEKFNTDNRKKAKFGGYTLDKLLYSDWVFTYRKGDSKRIDDIMRQSANDTALLLFNMYYDTTMSIKRNYDNNRQNNPTNTYQQIWVGDDYVKESFDKLITEFMLNDLDSSASTHNIFNNGYGETTLPGEKRLIDFEYNNNCKVKNGYEVGNLQTTNRNLYNVWNRRIYKGDNTKLDTNNTKAKLRRGFRMGDKTPDNPFMGFSMPATTNPDLVPDYIHLVYCDIYWKDFDTTQHEITDTAMAIGFDITPDKNTILGPDGLTYDFTGFIEKYHLDTWKAKGKNVIFRILIDEPTNERHKDCPEYIKGEYYDNKYGKGFSPNFKDQFVKLHYRLAIAALRRWINEHYEYFDGSLYTVEIPLGISGTGYNVTGGNITPITEIFSIYDDIYRIFFIQDQEASNLIAEAMVNCKLVFSSSVAPSPMDGYYYEHGWSFNNLGNRKIFEEWMKYNMYGADSTENGSKIAGGYLHGGRIYGIFNNSGKNKFKAFDDTHKGFSGVIRSDLSMDELMKPENFRELLYEMKTITPMYVIGYVDKERYPDQYEALMNEMGYKYTITSAVIEEEHLKVYYSNEGKNGVKSISDSTSMYINLKFKNKLKSEIINTNIRTIDRSMSNIVLNRPTTGDAEISNIKINMGDVKMFKTLKNKKEDVVERPYVSGKQFPVDISVENAYGKDMVDDVYLEMFVNNEYTSIPQPIKLANVNRTTEINLTDSGLLHMFISNYENTGTLTMPWFETMYMNHIKIDDNGWI